MLVGWLADWLAGGCWLLRRLRAGNPAFFKILDSASFACFSLSTSFSFCQTHAEETCAASLARVAAQQDAARDFDARAAAALDGAASHINAALLDKAVLAPLETHARALDAHFKSFSEAHVPHAQRITDEQQATLAARAKAIQAHGERARAAAMTQVQANECAARARVEAAAGGLRAMQGAQRGKHGELKALIGATNDSVQAGHKVGRSRAGDAQRSREATGSVAWCFSSATYA